MENLNLGLSHLMEDHVELEGIRLYLLPATEAYKGFILSTWFRSYWRVLKDCQRPTISYRTYQAEQPRVTEDLWSRSFILKPEDTDIHSAAGYICFQKADDTIPVGNNVLHYAYIIPELRKKKLFTNMIKMAFGNKPYQVSHIWPFPNRTEYNPWAIR